MNNYHKNIKLTIETNPSKFRDTRMDIKQDGHYITEVYQKETKLFIYWSSKVPKIYKCNSIKGDFTPL